MFIYYVHACYYVYLFSIINVSWILRSRKYFVQIMKLNNFQGDLTDISAKEEPLVRCTCYIKHRTDQYVQPVQNGPLEESTTQMMHGQMHRIQCLSFGRNIGQLTPKIMYFHYLKKCFLDRSIQKIVSLILKKEALIGFQCIRTDLYTVLSAIM